MIRAHTYKDKSMKLTKIFLTLSAVFSPASMISASEKPNIIYIMADDLGYRDLSCYGQKVIKTPNIDKIAAEGMMFTQHYSGSAVCAPTRCMLLTGMHAGHAQVRNNSAGIFKNKADKKNPAGEGQYPLKRGTETIGTVLQKQGYETLAVGKWGLGGPDNEGSPKKQGFDHFFGYLCQRQAHNYYPTHLWRNDRMVKLDGNGDGKQVTGKQYAPDLIKDEVLGFIDKNKKKPFFIYYATIIPHVSLQVPLDDPHLAEYEKTVKDPKPFNGGGSYVKNATPHATYAAMISRLDSYVGEVVARLKKHGLYDKTLIIFTSDNGPTNAGGGGASFFNSAGELRASKGSLYEGGIRVPFVARWKGNIKPGSKSDHASAGWDMLATFADLTGAKLKSKGDGISMLSALTGKGTQKKHDHMYWELGSQAAVRKGDWKAYRRGGGKVMLYNLANDIGEKKNLAASEAEKLKELTALLKSSRTEHADFRDPALPRKKKPKKDKK